MHTPTTAMLWELWRLTRRGLALQVSMSILAGLSALTVAGIYGAQDTAATLMLMFLGLFSITSLVSLKGRDSRVGFPLYLGYSRPVHTWLLAGVPMAYLAVSSALAYLIPAVVLRTAFDIHFPLAPVAGVLAAVTVVIAAVSWWTRNKAIQVGGAYVVLGGTILAYRTLHPENLPGNDFPPARWPEIFAFSLADYGFIAMLGAAAIGVAIVGVERQRRGDDTFTLRIAGGVGRCATALTRLVDALRVSCPTASPVRAQVWVEMKRGGQNVLAVGIMTALAIPVLFSLWNAYGLGFALLGTLLSPAVPVLVGVGSMLGFRRRHGVSDLSAFDATLAVGTARLVGVKLLVTVVCIFGAWALIATSFWISLALEPWGGRARPGLVEFLGAMSGGRLVASVTVFVIQFAAVVASAAVVQTFFVLCARRVVLAILGVGLYSLALALAVAGGWAGATFVETHAWLVAALIPMGTVYVFRQALADRILTPRATGAALVMWAGFTAICLALLGDSGMRPPGVSQALMALMASSTLVPLAAVALAPWSFNLLRHR